MNRDRMTRTYALAGILLAFSLRAAGATYFVDSSGGNDASDGLAPSRAWRSFVPVDSHAFGPGDRVALKAGGRWEGQVFAPKGSGSDGNPIRVVSYGVGPAPALVGKGDVPAVVRLDNQEYWEIEGLDISNDEPARTRLLRGVEVHASDSGILHHLVLQHLVVHNVSGPAAAYDDGDAKRKSYGGIAFVIDGSTKPTAWDDLRVEDCSIRDVNAIGVTFSSSWSKGHRENNPTTWMPSRNVIIRGNVFERSARNGLIVRCSVNPLIERNRFVSCAIEGSGNACFAFDCDGALLQFNEACFTRFNPGDVDAAGFDSDWNCRGSVFQYNYSHDNDYGFILLCCKGKGFNDGTVVRYNVSQNDGGVIIRVSGTVTHSLIHNNTIYVKPGITNPRTPSDPPRVIYFKSWDGWSEYTTFLNNIIVNDSASAAYEFGKSRNNTFSHNLFYGRHPSSEPSDPYKVTADPQFLKSPGTADGWAGAISTYRLKPGSAAIGAGIIPPSGIPACDYAGVSIVPKDGRIDLGALSH